MTNREIDILIAKRVMAGIFPDNPDKFSDKDEVWFYIKRGKLLRGKPYQLKTELTQGKILFDHSWDEWKPTEDIAAAWQVVDKLSDKYRVSIHQLATTTLWQCSLEIKDGKMRYPGMSMVHNGDEFANHEFTPKAICLAALKTVGIDEVVK